MREISEIISSEDKKNPYTDQELADMLSMPRIKVINERNKQNIPDSRDRRKDILLKDLKEILSLSPNVSERKLTELMIDRGYKISRNIISRVLKEFEEDFLPKEKEISEIEESLVPKMHTQDTGFNKLIGANGSLKNKIDLAKAAILYPPNGLHTLIYGGTGVGKSELAECMYEFAVSNNVKSKDAPFIIFNCADYAENPNLLISQLFGVVKGAYTGANADRDGLVEKANGGILFLDEIHRLPPEGQEILFYLIDKGKYRRLGETNTERKVNVLILGATTENPESNLLLTFRRRIPMLIELPKLIDRPLSERLEILIMFLVREANRINKNLLVCRDVLMSLMLYNCQGNIGQLKSDVQVICAKSYVKYMSKNTDEVVIDLEDLSNFIKSSFLKGGTANKTVMNLVTDDLYIDIKNMEGYRNEINQYVNENEIYQYIENEYQTLEKQGLKVEEIDEILHEKVENKLGKIMNNKNIAKLLNINELKTIVRPEVIDITEGILKIVREKYQVINKSFFIALAIHINFTIERILTGKKIIKSNINKNRNELVQEFEIAEKIRKMIEKATKLKIPEDECGYIALYIKKFCSDELILEPKVRVIIITHGHVAEGMAEVANQLLGVDDAIGIEIELDESPEDALERTIKVVKQVDEGKGCLLLVDMGSLGGFASVVQEVTGIRTKTIGRVDTLIALEAVRKASIEGDNLDNIVKELNEAKIYKGTFKNEIANKEFLKNKKKALVTVCLTGQGNALNIKKFIENHLDRKNTGIKIFPIGFIDQHDIEEEVSRLSDEYEIVAVCGTINPKVSNVPFISYESLLSGTGISRIEKLMDLYIEEEKEEEKAESLVDLINEELIYLDLDALSKEDVIDTMTQALENKGYVNGKFALSIYKREAMGSGIFNNKVAIPHGLPENVIKPAISIAKLKNPIQWDKDVMVDLVFMLALKENNRDEIRKLFSMIRDENLLIELGSKDSNKEIKKMFS
ncbi:sigma 54-interacting transcriptional regulator [Clostridium sp. 'White wine YQ']|uniref:sigma 54-interacting transcriptional regulator n=1 Tax=Clostridium sp. 'White wine YQ' TaxID=3027474 RepID=UPI0023658E41|nr:sigma 54-interacting transcriptional regulator [Clostridium sp. 'White wine YQ']MDD7796338.1 sigma 54-interacting transcriptional regulator [Clostridium sp. 'White wine YQ']